MATRGAGGVRGRERSSAVHFFSFLTGAMCSNQAEKYYMRGGGFFFLSNFFGFIYFVFAVLLWRAVISLSYIQQAHQNKKMITLPGVRTYVRHVSERSGRNRPRREAYMASELFFPEAWRWDPWHYQVASCLQLESF